MQCPFDNYSEVKSDKSRLLFPVDSVTGTLDQNGKKKKKNQRQTKLNNTLHCVSSLKGPWTVKNHGREEALPS